MADEILDNNRQESGDEEVYLQKVNLKKLSEETGLDYQGICDLVGIKEVKNLYKWTGMKMKGNGRPKYNAIVRLIEAGATVETLFGVEYKAATKVVEIKTKLTDLEIYEGYNRAAAALNKKPL